MEWKRHFQYAVSAVTQLFYPRFCEACGSEFQGDEEVLCLHCITRLPRTGFHHIEDNAMSRVFTGRVNVIKASAFLYFTHEGIVQHLLHRLKYDGRIAIGQYLGKLFAMELVRNHWLDDIDGILAVPLHRRKMNQRGYNQSDAFAEGLSEISGIPVLKNVLVRTRNTSSQTNKNRVERIENVRDVFLLQKNINNKHLLLVDDVLTTGATLEACAMAVLKGKGIKVSIVTLAMAVG